MSIKSRCHSACPPHLTYSRTQKRKTWLGSTVPHKQERKKKKADKPATTAVLASVVYQAIEQACTYCTNNLGKNKNNPNFTKVNEALSTYTCKGRRRRDILPATDANVTAPPRQMCSMILIPLSAQPPSPGLVLPTIPPPFPRAP